MGDSRRRKLAGEAVFTGVKNSSPRLCGKCGGERVDHLRDLTGRRVCRVFFTGRYTVTGEKERHGLEHKAGPAAIYSFHRRR